MQEFQIGEHTYRTEKLNAFDQLHLARKVAPLIPKILPALPSALKVGIDLKKAADEKSELSLDSLNDIAFILEPALDAMASMPKDDVEYVISLCLKVAKRKVGDTWQAMWVNNALMFGDTELSALIEIVIKVIKQNLGNYFSTGHSQSQAVVANS